jgi:hypothetical protein
MIRPQLRQDPTEIAGQTREVMQQVAEIDLAIAAGRDDKDCQHTNHSKRLTAPPSHVPPVLRQQLIEALRRQGRKASAHRPAFETEATRVSRRAGTSGNQLRFLRISSTNWIISTVSA